ncbi:MAG: DUF4249 family protein [Bacteroidota bacterium]
MRRLFIYIVMLMLVACEKQVDRPILAEDMNLVVVDATITNEHKLQSIRLTHTVTELNAIPEPLSGASVIISDAEHPPFFLTEQVGNPGTYELPVLFFAQPGVEYTLLISKDGKTYTAKTFMVAVTPFVRLKVQKTAGSSLYHITWVANPYDALHPAMYEILLDWTMVPGYSSLPPESCKARLYYYTLPTLDVSQIFAPEMEQIRFPLGTKIVERKYSLNPEHAEFVRAMISETNWKGGLFDSAPANVPTNLSDGALGFFAACAVLSDTAYVE